MHVLETAKSALSDPKGFSYTQIASRVDFEKIVGLFNKSASPGKIEGEEWSTIAYSAIVLGFIGLILGSLTAQYDIDNYDHPLILEKTLKGTALGGALAAIYSYFT